MANRKDYIPSNMAEFNIWFRNLNDYVEKKTSQTNKWNHIPEEELEKLRDAYSNWERDYNESVTSGLVSAPRMRNKAREDAEKIIRPFVKWYLQCPHVTDEERVEISIPIYAKKRTLHLTVTEKIKVVLVIKGPRVVEIHFSILGAEGKAKPYRYAGAAIRWALLDHKPKSRSELTNFEIATRTPFKLRFNEEDRGKDLYVSLAWQNARGIRGEWSSILSEKVP